MKAASEYSTSEVEKKLNLTRNALRLYEERGLLGSIKRTESGYRKYTEQDMDDLSFIAQAKEGGFTLAEIKELLHIGRTSNLNCGTVSQEIGSKIYDIEKQIRSLKNKKIFLESFEKVCGSQELEKPCGLLKRGFDQKSCC